MIMLKRRIVLTAGHQGKKTGASSVYGDEGTLTIELRDLIRERIKEGEVFVDPEKDSLSNVVRYVNRVCSTPTDICVDIHFNAAGTTATGAEVVVADTCSAESRAIARELVDETARVLGINNRGVKKASQTPHKKLAMCSDINCRSMVLEVCFVTNKCDMCKYNQNKERLADALAVLLTKWMNK